LGNAHEIGEIRFRILPLRGFLSLGLKPYLRRWEPASKPKAAGLIPVHNYPSGNLRPSAADRELTRALVKAGRALNLMVNDHLIIGHHGFFSLAEQNYVIIIRTFLKN
jgi:hypothetical protein